MAERHRKKKSRNCKYDSAFGDWLCLLQLLNALGRVGGRHSLFYSEIAVCLRYLLLSETCIKKFFLSDKNDYSIGKWVFRLKTSKFKS